PEAFLDGEEFVLNRHAFSGLGFATCPSQRLTEASVPGLTGVVDEKGAVVASEAPEGEAGGAGPLDGEARRERHRDEPGGTCANGFLDDLVGAAGGRQDEAVGWILACGGERADELVQSVMAADVLSHLEGDTGFAAEGGRVRGTGAVPQRLLSVKRLLRGKDGRLGERRVLGDRRQRAGHGFEVFD